MDTEFVIWDKDNERTPTVATATVTTGQETYVLHEEDEDVIAIDAPVFPVKNNTFSSSSNDGIHIVEGAPPTPESFSSWNARWSGRILHDRRFKRAIVVLLVLNAILMGVATMPVISKNPQLSHLFHMVDIGFLSLFTIEIVLRMLHYQLDWQGDGWFVFDVVIIGASWIFAAVLVLRSLRVLRTLRLATRFGPLRTVILAMGAAVPKLLGVFALLIFAIAIFSVMFTKLYMSKERDRSHGGIDYFDGIDSSAFTLLQIMTMDDWTSVARDTMALHRTAWIPFVGFIITCFIFISLCIAVVLDAVMEVQETKQELKDKVMDDENEEPGIAEAERLQRLERRIEDLTAMVERLTLAQSEFIRDRRLAQPCAESSDDDCVGNYDVVL